MSITYVIRFDVRPDQREHFLSLLNGVLDAMRLEPMFRESRLHVDPEHDCRYLLYETWASHEDVITHQLQRPYRAAWHAALPGLLRAPREIVIWSCVRSDDAAPQSERKPMR